VPEITAGEWDHFLSGFPDAHLLQTTRWGELKSAYGWKPVFVVSNGSQKTAQIGAQILFRKLPVGLSVAYIAKGPLYVQNNLDPETASSFWQAVDRICRREHAIFIKVEPDGWQSEGDALDRPLAPGFFGSQKSIQPRRTLLVDIQGSEEQILASMKQKTRYNIHLAEKKGVVVNPEADLDAFHNLMTLTGERDVFGVHTQDYYRRAYDLFSPTGECVLLIARVDGQPVAALMAFRKGRRAWYFYGASSSEHRERMPAYLLQWEAIRWARRSGCLSYDLWGVPDFDETTLEAEFMGRTGGLWGVYRFKRGFGGRLLRSAMPQDKIYQLLLYRLYLLYSRQRAED
jgi:peptidoglycan pentaglycine glycine transferase (the first glycine)